MRTCPFWDDLKTGKELSDHLTDTDGNIVWLVDGSGFFYIPPGVATTG